MLVPCRDALIRTFVIGSILAAATAATPANAERWKELPAKQGVSYRIDLDSVQWQGRIVRYRADIANNLPSNRHHGTVTELIDCDTGKRKLLESERYLPDGSVRKTINPVPSWQPIMFLSEVPHHFLCFSEE